MSVRSGWLIRSLADVPASDGWLSSRERETLAALGAPKRRAEWRLGRWTAKTAVAAWLERPLGQVEIDAAADGAPETLVSGEPGRVTLSLSHRAGRAMALVGEPGTAVGCDIEVAVPRSEAFLRKWLTPDEQALVAEAGPRVSARIANVLWAAKEAAAKVRGEGLLDTRSTTVAIDAVPERSGWRSLGVRDPSRAEQTRGWWREEPEWVMAVVTEPPTEPPAALR